MKGDKEYEDLCVNTVILKEEQTRKTMNSHKQIEGKLKKLKKKKLTIKRKTLIFHDWVKSQESRQG